MEISRDKMRRNAVVDFGHTLVNATLNRLLNARDSHFVVDAMQEVVAALDNLSGLAVKMPLQLQIDGTRLCHNGHPLDGPSLQAHSLMERCNERMIATLSFSPGITRDECNRLFDLLLLPAHIDGFLGDNHALSLQKFRLTHITVTLKSQEARDNLRIGLDEKGRAVRRYQSLADALQENHRLALGDHELAVAATATAVENAIIDFEEPSMLLALAMQDDVDRFTVGHSVRVALLALQVARSMDATREQLVRIGSAALMHDIGKSKVPQEILFKQGRLTEDEWLCMAEHPRLGAQILIEQHETVDSSTIGAAFCHHMSPDGGGYPDPLMPTPPSATSRLIRVCDVFEALTAVRPYKQALTPIEAFAVMFRNEKDFDPHWLRRFVKTLGLFPNGTRLQLKDGAEAVVADQTDDIRKPQVRLLSGPEGEALASGQPDLVSIGELSEGSIPTIAGIGSQDRFLPVPEFDDDPETTCPTAHEACLSQHPHDHQH